MEPSESPKQLRHQRNRRRRLVRAQQLQEKPLTMMVGSGDEDEDEDGEFESPPRTSKEDNNNKGRSKPPPPRRRRSRTSSNSFDEDIIDGFAIISFKTLEDLESFQNTMKNSINKKHHQPQRQAEAPFQQNLNSPLPSRPQSPLQTSQGIPNDASADSDSRPNSPVPYRERHMSKPYQTKKKPKKVGNVHIRDNINNSKFPRYQKNLFPRSRLPYGGEHSQDTQVTSSCRSSIQFMDNSMCPSSDEPQTNGPSADRLSDASSSSSTGNGGYQSDSESGDQASDTESDLFTLNPKKDTDHIAATTTATSTTITTTTTTTTTCDLSSSSSCSNNGLLSSNSPITSAVTSNSPTPVTTISANSLPPFVAPISATTATPAVAIVPNVVPSQANSTGLALPPTIAPTNSPICSTVVTTFVGTTSTLSRNNYSQNTTNTTSITNIGSSSTVNNNNCTIITATTTATTNNINLSNTINNISNINNPVAVSNISNNINNNNNNNHSSSNINNNNNPYPAASLPSPYPPHPCLPASSPNTPLLHTTLSHSAHSHSTHPHSTLSHSNSTSVRSSPALVHPNANLAYPIPASSSIVIGNSSPSLPLSVNGPRPPTPPPPPPPPPLPPPQSVILPPPPTIKSPSPQPKTASIQPPLPPVPAIVREPPKRTPPSPRAPHRRDDPILQKEKEPLPYKSSVGWTSPSAQQLYSASLPIPQPQNLHLSSLSSLHSHAQSFSHHPSAPPPPPPGPPPPPPPPPPPLHPHHSSGHPGPHSMFASPLPPPPSLTSTALQVPANVQSHFTDSMSFQATRPPSSKQCEHLDLPGGMCPSAISPYLHPRQVLANVELDNEGYIYLLRHFLGKKDPEYLPREVSNRLLAHDRQAQLGPASYMRTEMHQHQHQHMHQHQHTHQHTIGLTPPFSPSLVPNNAQHLAKLVPQAAWCKRSERPELNSAGSHSNNSKTVMSHDNTTGASSMFDKIPRYEPSFYRQNIPGLSFHGLPSLLTPAGPGPGPLNTGIPGAFQPKTINPSSLSSDPGLLSLRERVKPGPSPVTPKKTGKWCAVHVQVAWRIYHHQQKQHEAQKGGPDTKPVIDPLRSPSHLLPNSSIHRPPDLGTSAQQALLGTLMGSARPPFDQGPTHHSSFLNPAHIGVSPFARPSPYSVGFPGLPGNSLFNGTRELSSMSTLSPEWNRLHKTPSSFPTPPSWPKTDVEREREKERERERERELGLHDRRKEEERERERRNLERLTSLDMDRSREKDRNDRYREAERRRSRSRSRSPIRNGRLEPPKQEMHDKRHDDKSSLKIKEERREEDVHLLERDKLLRNNDYLFASLPHTAASMPVNMLERARMLGPRYYNNERPQLGVWNPYDKGFDMTHRLELRDIEREREHMMGARFNPNDLYFRERMFDRMPIFERERYEYEANKLPALRPVDPLAVGHFPRTVSPMVNHSSKSNSPASIPGAPPPLIPSSSTSHPRSHTNSPASSKSKASSPLDNVNELKDKRDTHSSSTDPDTHSR